MKNLIAKISLFALLFTLTSLKQKEEVGNVTLEVSYMQTMGGSAVIQNTSTGNYYYLNAVDTFDQIQVPYGSYSLVSAGTNSCGYPLIENVSTSTGYNDFIIDENNLNFIIYASCY